MLEYTLALLKPDCFRRGLAKTIIGIIKENGFEVIQQREVCLTLSQIVTIYPNFKHEQCFPGFVEFLQSGPCFVLLVKGENAIERLRELIGYGDPEVADTESIRGKFGESFRRNIIHASKDKRLFARERLLLFSKD